MNRLIDAFADEVLTREEFDPRIKRARKRLAGLETQLSDLQTETREQTMLHEALAYLDEFSKTVLTSLDDADWTAKRIYCAR